MSAKSSDASDFRRTGPVTFLNPEPMAPFLDVVAIGEAEALLPSLTDGLRRYPKREELLEFLRDSDGFYVPGRASGKLVRAKMGKRYCSPTHPGRYTNGMLTGRRTNTVGARNSRAFAAPTTPRMSSAF